MLEEYNRKRKFESTPEPRGKLQKSNRQRYVIQKHKASRLHYDLRLEMDGVLRSWAVPRGPSFDPGQKRLALQTEDHPVDYGSFEGVIPKGNYGAGQVIIWDRGSYEMVDPPTPQEAWRKQKFHIVLNGEKLRGEWVLVKTGRGDKEWLFFKVRDAFASPSDITGDRPESVVSGLMVEDLGTPGVVSRTWDPALERELEALGVKDAGRVPMPESVSPMLPTLTDRIEDGNEWIYELKLDGVRAIASKDGAFCDIRSRNQQPLGEPFPELVDALGRLPVDSVVIDGEIVVFDRDGRSRFSLLQPRINVRRKGHHQPRTIHPVWFSAFDLLYLNGFDLTSQPLIARKSLLRKLIPAGDRLRYTEHVEGDGRAFFRVAEEHGLEGVVAKRKDSAYRQGRSRQWLKVKSTRTDDFVVIGFTAPAGSRKHLGALVLGQYDHGKLRYVGRVGSGFDQEGLRTAREALTPLVRKTPVVRPLAPELGNVHWVSPRMVVEVRFGEWTPDKKLRAPVFVRFRDDLDPRSCEFVWENSDAVEREPRPGRRSPPRVRDTPKHPEFVPTNAEKVFWPADGITKGDLITYYRRIETTLAPYLEDRPLVLKRYPDGITGEHFYQKDAPAHRPEWVRTEAIGGDDEKREIHYIVGCQHDLLPYLANLGGITQNPWCSRVGRLEHPDYVIFDLDPVSGTPFRSVQKVALELNRVLEELQLRAYPKTSGASGIHVYLPLLEDRFTYSGVRIFAEAIATVVVDRLPELATIERRVRRRPAGCVYIDYLQNAKGQTVASVYSPRARPGAPVSTPVRWKELGRAIDPSAYNIRTAFRRLGRIGDIFRPVLEDRQDISPFLEALAGED